MRISVRKDDAGYSRNAVGTKVFVDGVEALNCFTADDELGIAYCFKKDSKGCLIIGDDHEAVEIEIKGVVSIYLPEKHTYTYLKNIIERRIRNGISRL